MKHLLALCALCWLPLSAPAAPNINVGVFYDYLDGDKSTYLKRVFNGGDSTAFIKVSVMEILYKADGSFDEARAYGWFVGWTVGSGRRLVFARLTQDDRLETPSSGLRARDALLRDLPALKAGFQ